MRLTQSHSAARTPFSVRFLCRAFHGPTLVGRPGTAHQIFTSWAAARPGPSSFHLVGRSPSRLLEVSSHGPRPGPAHQTLSGLAVARPSPSHFQNSRPGPARPINVSNIAARPCPAHDMAARPIKDRLHMGRPDILVGRLMGWPTCCAVPKCAGRLFKRHQVVYGCIYILRSIYFLRLLLDG